MLSPNSIRSGNLNLKGIPIIIQCSSGAIKCCHLPTDNVYQYSPFIFRNANASAFCSLSSRSHKVLSTVAYRSLPQNPRLKRFAGAKLQANQTHLKKELEHLPSCSIRFKQSVTSDSMTRKYTSQDDAPDNLKGTKIVIVRAPCCSFRSFVAAYNLLLNLPTQAPHKASRQQPSCPQKSAVKNLLPLP